MAKSNYAIFGVDFDGTVCEHKYPDIGQDNPGAVETLRALQDNGHKIILYTMRAGDTLIEAENWFIDNNITLWGVNENPTQRRWSRSPKVYAHVYIDDAALGCPLRYLSEGGRPAVDWKEVAILLHKQNYINEEQLKDIIWICEQNS